MKEATLSLSHPILFVMDFDNPSAEIPEYTSEAVASSTSSCVSIRAVADVDGDATVKLVAGWQDAPPEGFACVFEGPVLTASRRIAIVTADNRKIIEAEVSGEVATLRISVSNTDFPDTIFIEAR
jgi:hypothetical protein